VECVGHHRYPLSAAAGIVHRSREVRRAVGQSGENRRSPKETPPLPQHKVTMSMPPRELKRADAVFSVESDGNKFGELHISNGSIVWFPRSTTYGCKMGWERFHEMMEEHARRVEKR
jgi:hypothetical protein